jgi:hypothetical protein
MVVTFLTRMRKTFTGTALVGVALFLCFMVVGLPAAHGQEKEILPEANPNPPVQISQGPLQQINKYFSTQTIKYSDGTSLVKHIINGPPTPPPGYERERAAVALHEPNPEMGTNTLTVPAFDWVFGCSSVSAAMIAGYYDRNRFHNMYTGPTNGGVMPLNNSTTYWPHWLDGHSYEYPNLPLAASHNGVDGRVTRGSIDDYWFGYWYSSTPDPYIGHWTQHTWGEAIGDYMKTSQSAYGNYDGATTFYGYEGMSSQILTCSAMVGMGVQNYDGTYGRKLFYEARGYTVTDCYSQATDTYQPGGFSFAQYKVEIDAHRPVMLNLAGHTIVGVGYDDSGNTVYVHDTWDYDIHTMNWVGGASYSGMSLEAVSIVNLVPVAASPTVETKAVSGVKTSRGTLNGTVNPNGLPTTYYFQWGTTTSYGNVTSSQSAGSGTSELAFTANLTGLKPNITYHCRLMATNSVGIANGADMTFKTLNIAPPWLLLLGN